MNFKYFFSEYLIGILIFFISCTSGKSIQNRAKISLTESDSVLVKQRLILKKYAFCKCLTKKYSADSTLLNDGSLAGYLEIGSYGNRAYEAVDSFVLKTTVVEYSSKYKRKLYLMQCLDLLMSKELDSLVKKFDNNLNLDENK